MPPRQSENRKDARVAREIEIALPHELTAEQRLELTREFAQGLADRYGTAVDFAIHAPHGEIDGRNFHAHLMMTTRAVNAEGLGDKTAIERENKWLAANNLPLTQVQLVEIRQSWEQIANAHLARAGLEIQIDHRSHMERGLEIEPTEHMGVHATQMQRRGHEVSRTRLDGEAARRNTELIREKPEQVLSIVTGEKSVFDRRDVARALHRYIDQLELFQGAFARAMASPALVELAPEVRAASGEVLELARYSTREMVEIERGMVFSADRMSAARGHGVDETPCGGGAGVALLSCPTNSRRLSGISPERSSSPSSSDWRERARARCYSPRAKHGSARVIAFTGRRCPGKPPRDSRNLPASPLAPWRPGITAGRRGAGNWVLAMF